MDDPSSADRWNELYLAGDTGWDKGRASPPLVRLADERIVESDGWLLLPGAGRGHDALMFASKGYRVTAVDFAPEAVKAIRDSAARAKLAVDVQQRDLFTLASDFASTFHGIVEHTCFCAIDPARRAEYVEVVHACLKKGGVVMGLFYSHGREGGPPFDVTEAEIRALFAPRFSIERLIRAKDSFPERANHELEFVFRKS